jgi:tetratricopeptide (TPR) repeat protein
MRSWSVFVIFWLGLSALVPACAAGAADAVLPEVTTALAAGQYEDVVAVTSSGLAEAGPEDLTRARLLSVRGLARQALEDNANALADFTQALSITALPPQERARALFARGVSLDSMGRLNDAVGDYSAVLRLLPGAPYALNNRANVYRRQGRLDDASRDYLAALKTTNPSPQYPYFGLGQIAETRGDSDIARSYYSKALAAAPGFALALERLQAMGAPGEGLAGLPVNTGVIVLKPPGTTSPPVALHPPEAPQAAVPQKPARTFAASPGVTMRTAAQAPLRPTIVEGVPRHGRELVQLGAWRSEREARDGWAVARGSAGGLLDGLAPVIVRAEVAGRGAFWRLRVAPGGPVAQFCAGLAQKGMPCIPVRGGQD